jgi:hypothetical protein
VHNFATGEQTYHKKDFYLSYCNFLQQTAALYIYLSIGGFGKMVTAMVAEITSFKKANLKFKLSMR